MRRASNKSDFILVLCFSLTTALPFIGSFFDMAGNADPENRLPAPKPELNLTWKSINAFPAAYDRFYNDHFGFRPQLLDLHAFLVNDVLGGTASDSVLKGKNGWLFYADEKSLDDMRHASPLSVVQQQVWKSSLEERKNWLASKGIRYLFVVAPDKHSIYPEYLLDGIINPRGSSRLDGLIKTLDQFPNSPLLDLRHSLFMHKDGGRYLYYRTDTHWNQYGAYLGYVEIMNALAHLGIDVRPLLISEEKFRKIPRPWNDLAHMAKMQSDDEDYIPTDLGGSCVRYSQVLTPPGIDSSINPDSLVATHCDQGHGRLLIFRDSFSTSLVNHLSSTFERVVYVWNYPNDEMFIRFVEQEKPDVVIEERVERSMLLTPTPSLASAIERLSVTGTRRQTTEALIRYTQVTPFIFQRWKLRGDALGGELLFSDSGQVLSIQPGLDSGSVDEIRHEGGYVVLGGWAADANTKTPAEWVLVTVGNSLIFIAEVTLDRPDVSLYFDSDKSLRSGFVARIPEKLLLDNTGGVRVFGLQDGHLSELTISEAISLNASLSLNGRALSAQPGKITVTTK